jgi:hypothetical protein
MVKWTTFATVTDEGQPLIQILNGDLEKTASFRSDVQDYINTMEKQAGHTYVLVNAMTAGEYFGPNLNGDYFPEGQLQTYHKTFEKYANAYRHHVNKDPEKRAGKVIYASYHPEMHRVELIIDLENDRAQDILDRLNKGEFPAVSMGTRTPSDRCSICGNRAKNTAAYCNHLKYEMRRIMPDGRRVMAMNDDKLTFFDISFVRIPADRTASVITKVGHVEDDNAKAATPSAIIGDEWLKRGGIKESTLFKEVPGTVEGFTTDKDPHGLIMATRKPLPKDELDKIANEYPLKDILSTLLATSLIPTPEEFQRIIIIKLKNPDLLAKAEEAAKHGHHLLDLGEDPMIPVNISMYGFNKELAEKVAGWIPDSGMTRPLIMKRVLEKRAELVEAERTFIPAQTDKTGPETHTNLDEPPYPKTKALLKKKADLVNIQGPLFGNTSEKPVVGPRASAFSPEKSPIWALEGLGALYWGYLRAARKAGELGTIGKFFSEGPQQLLIPALMGALAVGTTSLQSGLFEKKAVWDPLLMKKDSFLPRLAVTIPGGYIAAGHQENKLQQGKQISKFEDLVRKHPFITGATAFAGATALEKKGPALLKTLFKKAGVWERVITGLADEPFERLYTDIVEQ